MQIPGIDELRQALSIRLRRRPKGKSLRRDAIAGLTSAVANVPDGMANGLLVGVNPVHGLYAAMAGPFIGGMLSNTGIMVITTTAAASLTAGQALGSLHGDQREASLFIMVLLAGSFQALFGLLKMGRLIRFVSFSVMKGFLTGVSILLILSQIPTVTGIAAEDANKVTQALEVFQNITQISRWSFILALLTLSLAIMLRRSPIRGFANLLAVALPSLITALLDLNDVALVRDRGEISGIPLPILPDISSISVDVITGAFAVAVVILVQGAGVSQNVPNGRPGGISRDFIAEGFANVASSVFRGLPVGGSLSATALNLISGAGTRWSVIFAGLWMAIIVLVFPGLVG